MWEEKQTKQQINREVCKKQLRAKLKPLIPITALLCFISIFVILITIGIIGDIVNLFTIVETVEFLDIFWIVFLYFPTVFTSVLIVLLTLYFLIKLIIEHYKINKGSFYAVEDKLIRKSQNERIRWLNTNVIVGRKLEENAFYFAQAGRYALSPVDISSFEYSSIDDIFYVIIFDGNKQKPQLAFNSKVYEWKN